MLMSSSTNYQSNVVACRLWDLVESPTQYILGLEVFNVLSKKARQLGLRCWVYSHIEFTLVEQPRDVIAIVPERLITGVGRVDFAIYLPGNAEPVMVVECDGHNFHNSPEQSSIDRRRDRTLQRLGAYAFRFTGTDIVRASLEAAHEIADDVIAQARQRSQAQQKETAEVDF